MDPKEEIHNLINRTRTLYESYNNDISSGIISDNASLAGEVIRKILVPRGLKGFTKDVAKEIKKKTKENINAAYLQKSKSLISLCEQTILKMSQKTSNLGKEGNSYRLVRKFNKIKKYKTPEAILRNLLNTLEEIASLELIYNVDIPTFIHKKHLAKIKIEKYYEIVNLLNSYPIAQNNLLAAIQALQYQRIGSYRNCITSCRVTIERLCLDIGKKSDWKQSLKEILTSKSDQKMVKNTWNYLSGKGAHGGHTPTKEEAALCLDMTISTIKYILTKV